VGALPAIGKFRMIPNYKFDLPQEEDPMEESKENIP
jgi:hypothetical protein